MSLCRVTSSSVLIVPPFECAWLSGDEHVLRDGSGCISFEVKGDNDVTIIIKPFAGSKRWQHMQRPGLGAAAEPMAQDELQVDPNYTVILGSHGNRCLKIEKNGSLCCMVDVPGAKLPGSRVFSSYWLDYNKGTITVGCGSPGEAVSVIHQWSDPSPLHGVRFVGLSSWDTHVGYKNIRVGPALDFAALSAGSGAAGEAGGQQAARTGPALLSQIATSAVAGALTPGSVLSVLGLAHALAPALDALQAAAVSYVARHFEEVAAADRRGLSALPASCLSDLLRHPELNCPEYTLFEAAMFWAGFGEQQQQQQQRLKDDAAELGVGGRGNCSTSGNSGNSSSEVGNCSTSGTSGSSSEVDMEPARRGCCCSPSSGRCAKPGAGALRPLWEVEQVLPLVRFPLMSELELQAVARHPCAASSRLLADLLLEAGGQSVPTAVQQQQQLQQQRHDVVMPGTPAQRVKLPYAVQGKRLVTAAPLAEALAAVRFQRRRPPAWRELIYICDGDANGVCHHLGTNLGTEPWVNPALAGRVSVSASSPAGRHTDPRGLVSRQFLRTSFAGPAYSPEGRLASWWAVDLGERCRLVCNYYSMRHDGSHAFPRSWTLQGSLDGGAWADLRQHNTDSTLKLPGQYGSWPVAGPAAAQPWRMFRVLMTGPSADPHCPYNLCLSNLEFYGYFFTLDDEQHAQQQPQ